MTFDLTRNKNRRIDTRGEIVEPTKPSRMAMIDKEIQKLERTIEVVQKRLSNALSEINQLNEKYARRELSIQDEIKSLEESRDIALDKLKECRAIMRDNNIGHLYPGVDYQYEANHKLGREVAASNPKTQHARQQQINVYRDEIISQKSHIEKLERVIIGNRLKPPEFTHEVGFVAMEELKASDNGNIGKGSEASESIPVQSGIRGENIPKALCDDSEKAG